MQRRSWKMRIATFAGVIAVVLGGVLVTTTPAAAAGEGALTIAKSVSNPTPAPGDEFTFNIRVSCSDNDCVNASLTDMLPDGFDGFPIVNYNVTPGTPGVDWTAQVTGCTNMTVVDGCGAVVTAIHPLAGGGKGLPSGGAVTLSVTLKVPSDLSPTWPYNGTTITNEASVTADNAATQSSSASVTINVPVTVDTAVTKDWTPTSEQYAEGAQSTINLTTQNTSNVPASTLVLQEPATAVDGASTLDPSNPFLYTDFAGLGTITLPDGADRVQVDAYVKGPDGTYSWVNGDPGPPPAVLPGSVTDNADVAGIRITFSSSTGDTITANGSAGSVPITVTQRATNRDTDAALDNGWTATNEASGTVNVPGHDPVTKDATAEHSVVPINVRVTADKSFTPSSIPGGTQSIGKVTATNASDGTLDSLTISDQGYFTALLPFDGFTGPMTFPASSTSATIVWTYSDDSTSTSDFGPGTDNPPSASPPASAHVTGFEITFHGPIDQGASASASFGVTPALAYTAAESPRTSTNTVDVSGASGDKSAQADANADLTVYAPDIDLDLTKKIVPDAAQSPVAPGGTVTVQLPTTTSTETQFVQPNSITVTDVAPVPHDTTSFWNAFNPIAIAPTQVPAGATLNIEYTTDDGDTWTAADWCGLPVAGVTVYQCTIPSGLQGSITGLKFEFTDPDGFPQGTTVQPNLTFQARADQRYGNDPTSVPDAGPTVYDNTATAQGEGEAGGTTITGKPVTDDDNASIETHSGANGTLIRGKSWVEPTNFSTGKSQIDSQSSEQAGTVLNWGVTSTGYASLTVSDPGFGSDDKPADPGSTVFQAFNLTAIAPITTTQDPLLQWDTVSQVQLYENGAWVTIDPPSGSWMSATGFKGYSLSPAEQEATTGMRITVVPNDDARTASTDPTRPLPGSGIASSSVPREFDLVWTLRNTLRVPSHTNTWVNGTTHYNTDADGLVNNHEQIDAVPQDGAPQTTGADDQILIIDQPPGVSVTKATQNTTIPIPHPGDVPVADYPTNDFTVTANSTSSSRASYVRVTDPMPCSVNTVRDCVSAPEDWAADPYVGYSYTAANPFDAFTLTGLSFSYDAAEVDPNASVVTLLHYGSGGQLTTTTTTIAAAQAMSAADLADVVGVSVVYQGTDPATTGGTITSGDKLTMVMHTQVRQTLRSDPTTYVTPRTVSNQAFAQSYDPVLYPAGDQQGSTPFASDGKDVQLTEGQLDVTASKTISPTSMLQADRTNPVTVTLGATQGPKATVPTNQVTIEDSDQSFWNDMKLTSFAASDVTLPAGADQVRVDVQLNGSTTWTLGTAAAAAALPAGTQLDAVTGIRFVFSRSDGGLFSNTAPPQPWTASAVLHVQLLDTARDGTTIPFPGSVDDRSSALTQRTDGTSDLYPDVTDDADASLALDPGSFRLDVAKAPAGNKHTVTVGSSVPWTLTFTNTGTGVLTVPQLVDTLPKYLTWNGTQPTYTDSAGGTLSTDVTLTPDTTARTLTFSWPDDGQQMRPGETFTITIGLILQPGLNEGESTTNQMVVNTDQTLSACTNTSGNGQGTVQGLPATDCGTTNYVQPVPGPALQATKGVQGDVVDSLVSGASDPNNPDLTCLPVNGYYYAPCVANTRMGGTDEWLVTVTNSGTVPYTSVTLVDPLPVPGDKLLATGAARGSDWKAVFDESYGLQVNAPDGSTQTLEVSTDPQVCIGSGTPTQWSTDPTCSGSTWTALADYTGAPDAITGLRVVVTLPEDAPLAPGDKITASVRTINEPESASDPQGMTTTVPQPGIVDYNQVGVQATLVGGGAPLASAPTKVGVSPLTGSLQVVKKVTGTDASRAPDSFEADVTCAAADAQLDLGDASTLTLTKADGLEGRIDGIPVGASCDVAENGDAGSYGEDARTIDPSSVTIAEASTSDDPVPAAQIVTITNRYDAHPPTPTPSPTPGSGGSLPGTGSDLLWPLLTAAGLMLAGAVTALVARRRRRRV